MRITPLALAAGLLLGGGKAGAQAILPDLDASRGLEPAPRGDAARRLPIILRADRVQARPDLEAVAEGEVEFRRGATVIRADRLSYDSPEDLASARGRVRIETGSAVYSGPELQLRVQRFEGFFQQPEFEFTTLGAGGRAERVDFLGSARAVATEATYTSCPRDGSGDPDWVLQTRRVRLDFDANEGIAEGAVLRFMGAPILALPALSFPLTEDRKSGWLPPSVNLDSRSGLELAVPYYWNIAPNRDATIVPRAITRRGFGVDGEFRYLQPSLQGQLNLSLLPSDRVADRERHLLQWRHEGTLRGGTFYSLDTLRVSDSGWWRDFPGATGSLTPRLLANRGGVERPFALAGGEGLVYARAQHWQVLQGSDTPVTPPYQRSPQVGLRWGGALGGGFEAALETELNHFTRPGNDPEPDRATGKRLHVLGAFSRPWREPGVFLVPRLSFNAASYRLDRAGADGRRDGSRLIPTFSVDGGLEFERGVVAFGRALRQTLEPRVLYVNTPFEAQSQRPNFDSAAKDFNISSIYSENSFSGVDRVADQHQITAGLTTRLVDETTGGEALRLAAVQRILLRDQRVAPGADGSADGPPLQQRVSDLLLLGSTTVFPRWTLDGALQYSPDQSRAVRTVFGARYSPGPYRTVNASYRLARGLNEQLELGWQWPVYRGSAAGGKCGGAWYSVGRMNYSLKDSRITDSILGLEFDAGCWIGRVVAERLSTGRSAATTRLLLQLELVGLSRIGSNPLRVLKDNIPGYRLLRDERRSPNPSDE